MFSLNASLNYHFLQSNPSYKATLKSEAIQNFICDHNYNLSDLSKLKEQSITINNQDFIFNQVNCRSIQYGDNNYLIVNIDLRKPSFPFSDNSEIIAHSCIVLQRGETDASPLMSVSRTDAAQIRASVANATYLPIGHTSKEQLISYTHQSYYYLNKYLRDGEVIKDVAELDKFHLDMMSAANFSPEHAKNLNRPVIENAYEKYRSSLAENPKSKTTAMWAKQYLSIQAEQIQRNFISADLQADVNITTTYRGIGINNLCSMFPNMPKDGRGVPIIYVGCQAIDPAFVSSSTDINRARRFAFEDTATQQRRPADQGVLIEIEIDQNNPPLRLSLEPIAVIKGENEILFAPNSVFTVTKVNAANYPMRISGTMSRAGAPVLKNSSLSNSNSFKKNVLSTDSGSSSDDSDYFSKEEAQFLDNHIWTLMPQTDSDSSNSSKNFVKNNVTEKIYSSYSGDYVVIGDPDSSSDDSDYF